jgi:hypothetical protein
MYKEATNTDKGKNMLVHSIQTDRLQGSHLPLWKRCVLVSVLLLSAGALAPVTCFAYHSSYSSPSKCIAGRGGPGGIAKYRSSGTNGGPGGDCVFAHGAKTGTGGIQGDYSRGANGGNIIIKRY